MTHIIERIESTAKLYVCKQSGVDRLLLEARDEIEQLRFELSVAKEREKIDSTESELANARIAALEGAIDAVTDSSEYDYDECPSDCSVPIDVLESMDRVRWDTDAKERGSSDE